MDDGDNQQPKPLGQPSLTEPTLSQPPAASEGDSLSQEQESSLPLTEAQPQNINTPSQDAQGNVTTQSTTESPMPSEDPVISTPMESSSPPTPPPPTPQALSLEQPIAPPPPPPTQAPPPPMAENPEVKEPDKGKGTKKIFFIIALILALVAGAFLVFNLLLPRLQSLRLPGFPGKEVTLTYWGLWEPSSVMQEIINEFHDQNPGIKIEYAQQSHKEYRERLQSAIARSEGPDIFRFHNTWVPMFRDELDKVPADVYSAGDFQDTFYPVAANDLRSGGTFVGIPLEVDGLALLYNKKIFQAAGKSPPTNWEELRKTAFDLTVRDQSGRIQTAGAALGTTGNIDHWPDILALMMYQNGADLNDPTDKLAADALLFYTLFFRSDKVWDATFPNSTQAFASGKLAMMFAPSWRILEIQALNSQLEFGVLPVPLLPNSNVTWASYWVEGVSSSSEYKPEAWKFLKFLSSKETLEKLYQAASNERAIGEPYSRTDMSELLKDDPLVGAYISQAPTAKSWYLSSSTHDNGINDRIIKYFEDAVNSVNSGGNPESALKTASQGVNQILEQYRVK